MIETGAQYIIICVCIGLVIAGLVCAYLWGRADGRRMRREWSTARRAELRDLETITNSRLKAARRQLQEMIPEDWAAIELRKQAMVLGMVRGQLWLLGELAGEEPAGD